MGPFNAKTGLPASLCTELYSNLYLDKLGARTVLKYIL